ncbi:MAG: hypothetical protein ACRD1R_17555 [Acidobacteriota bacterium]
MGHKRWIIAGSFLLLLTVGLLLLLRSYTPQLVHTIVVNAVIQKAPQGYSAEKVREAFTAAREKAHRKGRQDEYLSQLLRISQRLEKLQYLSREELDELVAELHES